MYPKLYLYKRIVDAKLFIDKHYAENINLEQIADTAHFSKFHFLRLFKNAYGMSPHQYLTDIRIRKSKSMIDSGHSILESCLEVGFESPSSFTHLFKKQTGKSPREYQQMIRNKHVSIEQSPFRHIPGCFASQLAVDK